MRKIIFLALALWWLPVSAQDLQLRQFQYWIDEEIDSAVTLPLNGETATIEETIDANQLREGMHTLHYRISDTRNVWSPLFSALFYKQQRKATQVKALRYWWGDRYDKAVDVDAGKPTFTYEALLSVPEYAKRDPMTAKGVARFHCLAIDNLGRMSETIYQDVIYDRGPILQADKSITPEGTDVKLSWTYTDEDGVKDYIVYYSKDNGPYVMYEPSMLGTSINFKGNIGTYRFLVVARNNLGQRTSMDDEWTVTVVFN